MTPRSAAAQATGAAPTPAPASAARAPGDTTPALVSGVVWDSLAAAPLAGAVVQVVDAATLRDLRSARADSLGRWRLAPLPPGRWLLAIVHPTLDELDLDSPNIPLDLAPGSALDLTLGLPGPRQMRAVLCGAAAPGDSSGALVGLVRDAESGEPVEGALVSAVWNELTISAAGLRQERRRIPVRTRGDGRFLLCGLPTDGSVSVRAELGPDSAGATATAADAGRPPQADTLATPAGAGPRRTSGELSLDIAPATALRLDLVLGEVREVAVVPPATPTTPDPGRDARTRSAVQPPARPPRLVGPARLTGVVRDDRGRPLARARVVLVGGANEAVAGDDGTFRLDSLPTGSWTVEARALGFVPSRAAVALAAARPAAVTLVMGTRVNTLGSVTVYGQRTRFNRTLDEFMRRRQQGMGRFLTAAEVAARNPIRTTDVFQTTLGVRWQPGQGFNGVLRGRGGCVPAVAIDGMPIHDGADELDNLVMPQQIMGIEIYPTAATAPAQYGGIGANACGVVLVWTFR